MIERLFKMMANIGLWRDKKPKINWFWN